MTIPGKLIEYLDGGKFICAFVTEAQDKRLRLTNQTGRELNLPLSRVLHISRRTYSVTGDREAMQRQLHEAADHRRSLMEEINLEEIWELTADESTAVFEPVFLAELAFGGETDDNQVAAFIRCVFSDRLYFKFREGEIHTHSREQVEQLRLQQEKEQSKQALLTNGAMALNKLLANETIDDDLRPVLDQCLPVLQDFYLFAGDAPQAAMARELLKTAGLNDPHAPFHLLVKAGIWDRNENIPLLRQEIPTTFSLAARQQAEMLLQRGTPELFDDPGRTDLTALAPITIDGATTLDYDDALSIEQEECNYLVGVHISDVAHYVKPEDPLFLEAMQRGTSLYFPEGQIPMLPRHLSQGICSLIQGEVRATLSIMILLSPEAEVLRVRIKPSIIKVARRLTYDEADQLIADNIADRDWELQTLNMLRTKLRDKRVAAGALLLPFPDINISVNGGNTVQISLSDTDTPARTLVSELMILANTEAAKYVADRMAPGLFRAQGPPRKRIVHGLDNDLFLNSLQRKQLSRGELLTSAKAHSGLGVEQYTTITSPIRRLLDLLMQHQLHSLVRREDLRFNEKMCKDFTAVITRTLTAANAVKQQRHRYWLLKYLEAKKGTGMNGLVLDSNPRRVFLLLTDILMDIDLPAPAGQVPQPGVMVQVKVTKVDALDNSVRFEW
ncbi:MAG: RNB domain-containing ribonuclease, partial [Desulfocapsaceae bacterium]|nr:RNB domain-containing ribonuclease [Desulfocapsaceae bacterium]